jgi:phospholipase C
MSRVARTRPLFGFTLAVGIALALFAAVGGFSIGHVSSAAAVAVDNSDSTTTPIKHVVVIYDENVSFDHYFGTYPYAENKDGTNFCPAPGTAGLPGSSDTTNTELGAGLVPAATLGSEVTKGDCDTYAGATPNPEAGATPPVANPATPNPNSYQPQRIPDTAAVTCDSNHSYTPEEEAEDGGKMDKFVQFTSGKCAIPGASDTSPGIGMDYYDGNTVSGLWNYAQHYGMSDNSWDATFGPTMIGSLNMFGATTFSTITNSTYISNTNPAFDNIDGQTGQMGGDNIGTLLNGKGVSWGWFEEGFGAPGTTDANVNGRSAKQFSSIYETPDWWQATSNPDHTPPASNQEIGFGGPANHNYDAAKFTDALNGTGGATLPAVSFLRADEVRTGHPSVSDPLDEQKWIISDINAIEQSAYWPSTSIVIEYDDSDGFYDHQAPTIINSSNTGNDAAICSDAKAAGVPQLGGQSNRCGPSQRLPYMVISPYAKPNHVDHGLVTQDSTLKFIEKNWGLRTIGPSTFDNLPQIDDLSGFFDWDHPQQNAVLLDGTCNVQGLAVVLNTCNNTTANAASDGVTDDGTATNAGFGAVHARPAVTVPAPPTETVDNDTITVPASPTGTLSSATLLSEVGATISQGTLSADTTNVNLQAPGTYTAKVSGTYRYTSTGINGLSVVNDVESVEPKTVTVNVVPTVSVAAATLTYEASNPPSAATILSDAGASINSGTLATPDLTGVDLSTPGTYTVSITGSENGEQATPVPVTITVIPAPAITLANTTVRYRVGESPTPVQVLADAGATINTGDLNTPDLSGVDFTRAGSATVTIGGSSAGFAAAPATLTVEIVAAGGSTGGTGAPKITVAKAAVAYLVGAHPSSAQVLDDAGARTTAGSLSVGLGSVDFGKAGVYPVTVTGADGGVDAQPVPLAIDVVRQPAVALGSSEISTLRGAALSSDQVLADTGASVPGGSVAAVDLSGVDFSHAGTYTVKVGGAVAGLGATPATVTIHVIEPPVVTVSRSQVSYPSGSSVSSAALLEAAGVAVSGQGTADIDLSAVDFATPGTYSAQVTGSANGIAAAPVAVVITVRPVISLRRTTVKYAAASKLTGKAVLKAAGADISSGSLATLSLKGVIATAAGTYTVNVGGTANGVAAAPVALTIVVNPKLTVAHRAVRVTRGTHLTTKLLVRTLGIKLTNNGKEKLKLSFAKVNTHKRGTYAATVRVVDTHGATAASVTVHVTVTG